MERKSFIAGNATSPISSRISRRLCLKNDAESHMIITSFINFHPEICFMKSAKRFEPKFLPGAALLLESDKILVIGDLHLGLEHEISRSGIRIPSQTEKIMERIDKFVHESKAKHLVFLGDVKHNIPVSSFQEDRELPTFLNHFAAKIKTSLVKGNHDGDIEKLSPSGIRIYPSSGFGIKNFWLAHGQSWPPAEVLDCEYLVIGHDHPAVQFCDKVGSHSVEQCWLVSKPDKEKLEKKYGKMHENPADFRHAGKRSFPCKCKLKKIISVPVFNRLIGGMPFNRKSSNKSGKKFKPLSPILQTADWKHSEVYLLDGTYLGTLDGMKRI